MFQPDLELIIIRRHWMALVRDSSLVSPCYLVLMRFATPELSRVSLVCQAVTKQAVVLESLSMPPRPRRPLLAKVCVKRLRGVFGSPTTLAIGSVL